MFFLDKSNNEDYLYREIRDNIRYSQIKEQLIQLWESYKTYSPHDFLKKIQIKDSFHQRWWEMYCGVGLLNMGISLNSSISEKGPDFQFQHNKRYFIEAIAPKVGDGENKLQELKLGVHSLPEDKFLLRITSAIEEKLRKFQNYIDDGIVCRNDCLIIALSSCNLSQYGTLMDYPVPAPLKVLCGIGCEYINLETGKRGLVQREDIIKVSGNKVGVKFFDRSDMSIISGVLYSNTDPLNSPGEPEKTFTMILNPNASSPVDKNIFKNISIIN